MEFARNLKHVFNFDDVNGQAERIQFFKISKGKCPFWKQGKCLKQTINQL